VAEQTQEDDIWCHPSPWFWKSIRNWRNQSSWCTVACVLASLRVTFLLIMIIFYSIVVFYWIFAWLADFLCFCFCFFVMFKFPFDRKIKWKMTPLLQTLCSISDCGFTQNK
jgi:hypothetical protein